MQKIFIEVTNLIKQLIWTVSLLSEIIFVHYSTFLQLFTRPECTLWLLIQNSVIPPLKFKQLQLPAHLAAVGDFACFILL